MNDKKRIFTAYPFSRGLFFLLAVLLGALPAPLLASELIVVTGEENGSRRTGQLETWHDHTDSSGVEEAARAHAEGAFKPLKSAGSTGLKRGAFWSHFVLHNPSPRPVTLNLEYVDHQLIELAAYQRPTPGTGQYHGLARLSMQAPFDQRPIDHHRFILPLELQPGQHRELLVRFSSAEAGFVFPSMRIWTPDNLRKTQLLENSVIAFLFGGFFLMAVFSLVCGVSTGERTFYFYSVYALSKVAAWGTILGFTHQYLLREQFQWHYMSITGAVSILCGLAFARLFLQSRRYTPRLDRVLVLMMANAALLLIGATLQLKVVALVTITVALLLYPVVTLVAIARWRQGSGAAAVFALAWGLLVTGLFTQALRDLGVVGHNLFNYYWPPIASFTEMLTIMAAMGIRVRSLGQEKRTAEQQYRQQLERSKAELEAMVCERTHELEAARQRAELEARTDPLTGICNRRSFIDEAQRQIHLARHNGRGCSLLMFDLDHFKAINDSHGHAVGDEALRRFTRCMLDNIRETDVFGRLGGEEFGLLVTGSRQNAQQTAERLRAAVTTITVPSPAGILTFTTSIGLAHKDNCNNLETLLVEADRALYQAKQEGRNRVADYREPAPEPAPA
ncbi:MULTISPECIES: diguanylate cyclase [Microbulbifer]|uniref:sensor domain-containing diguanylate cyclase n=1 Tax=Microbulbifer TaxID=48073 RepID=UPI001E4BE1ED|nr:MULTISPECIES: diguanylate cyclase [Microbulbifer]UHQ54598.1 diguanylate cyclase [Microbulbifer sp. YPW16]